MAIRADHMVHPELTAEIPIEEETHAYRARYLMAAARLALGWVFLWAFLDKLFGLGFATARDAAWISGGSPTYGYLNYGTEGKILHEVFAGMAGPVTDWLFMLGLLGIGVAMMLGVGMRIAAASAATMLGLMWLASFRIENNPFVDSHVVYAIVAVALAVYGAGRHLGLGRWWEDLAIVRRFPLLK